MPKPDSSQAADQTPAAVQFDERLGHHLYTLASSIHRTPGHLRLYLMATLAVVVIVLTAGMQVVLNAWNQPFYDAIARKATGEFLHQLMVFFGIAAILLVLNVSQTGLNQMIRLVLRDLATRDLIDNWMTRKRASRIGRAGEIGTNPDQRIQADAQHLTELTTDLGMGLVQATVLLLSFIGVLWVLSSGIVLRWDGEELSIPGYMVWAALIYAVSGSLLSWRIGRPLVRLEATHYGREAEFRSALVQGANEADTIALNNGEAEARRRTRMVFDGVLAVMQQIVRARVQLSSVTAGYGWVALVVPIIVAAPGYFGGKLTFGELMMVVGAFNQVQQALRWFVDNTGVIADWRATLLRVMSFRQALLELDGFEEGVERYKRLEHPEGRIALHDLTICGYQGRTDLSDRKFTMAPGERVLIVGKSGAGKSTLFLSIAGLWDWGHGRISLPPPSEMMFLSQRPFMPTALLRDLLTFAAPGAPAGDLALASALHRVGLDRLLPALDRKSAWDRELTADEQDRLTLARVLIVRPKWLICDEALDLLDESLRNLIESIFSTELADSGVLTIASIAPPPGFYTRVARLVPHADTTQQLDTEPRQRRAV